MKHILWIVSRRIFSLALLLCSNLAFADDGIQIAIVKSSNNSYFNQTIQTLVKQTNEAVQFEIFDLAASSENPAILQNSDLIITLGTSATQTIQSEYPTKLLISAYLTEHQYKNLKLESKQHLAVLLDQPLERYLAFSHLVLDAKSVGIVNHESIKLDRKQHLVLKQFDLKLRQYQLEKTITTEQILNRIRQLIGQNDALLMLPDQSIYNRNSLKGVLLTTYRSRTSVISYSPSHVKSGALASIYSSPDNIGKHLRDLLNRFLTNKTLSTRSPHYARYYSLSFNSRVAHALRISLPDNDSLRARLDEILK